MPSPRLRQFSDTEKEDSNDAIPPIDLSLSCLLSRRAFEEVETPNNLGLDTQRLFSRTPCCSGWEKSTREPLSASHFLGLPFTRLGRRVRPEPEFSSDFLQIPRLEFSIRNH